MYFMRSNLVAPYDNKNIFAATYFPALRTVYAQNMSVLKGIAKHQ